MQIKKFYEELTSIHANWSITANPTEEIYSFKPFPSNEDFEPNIIYLGRISKLLFAPREGTFNFLCIDDQNGSYDLPQLQTALVNCNLIITNSPVHFRDLCDIASGIFLAEIKYTSYISQMLNISNANKGLTHLVDETIRILKYPIIIVDTSYKILAMYHGIKVDSRPDLEAQRELGYLTDQTLKSMKQDKIYEKIRAAKYPVYEKQDGAYGWLNTLVYIHGIEVAQIGMMELDPPFTSYDFELLHFFSQLVSWEMQKNDFYKNNRGVMHSVFLSELLDRKITSPRIVKLRMEQLNWTDAPYLYVLTIFDNEIGDFNQKAQIIVHQLQHLLPSSRFVIYDTKLVFLVQQTVEDTALFNQGGPIEECLAANQLPGVLSNCFSNLIDIRKFYEQTLKIYELRQIIKDTKFIHFYSDYMFYHIGQIISEKYDLKDFYHPALIKIIHYDGKNQTNFTETLHEYLLHIDNPTLCAQNLFIHKNTFFYRMNKIRELFHLDLNNGEERLKLHLTLEFLKLEDLKEDLKK